MISITELVKGAPGGAYGIMSRKAIQKSGRIFRGKGLVSKIPGAKKIHKDVVTGQMGLASDKLRNPVLSTPSVRDKKLARAIDVGQRKLAMR